MAWNIDDDFLRFLKRTFKQLGASDGFNRDTHNVRSWSHGYSITLGPDGKPVVKEWGSNLPETTTIEQRRDEPLSQVDIDRDSKTVKVILELPGITKESIKITGTETSVRVKADYASWNIDHEVPISEKVDPTTARATYKNGVLDISLDLVEDTEPNGVNIQIE